MSNICDSTYGQIVYQEQILRILGEVFDFDWTHRAEVRRIISKKHGDQEFNRRWQMALEGAMRLHEDTGMTPELAKDIWGRCITAGSYAFNASHAVAYGKIAVYTMFFKRHYPEIFYKAMLNVRDDVGQKLLLRDSQRFGRKLEVKPPHPKWSDINWVRKDRALVAGFAQVPGIGDKLGAAIVQHREEHGDLHDWDDLINVKGIGAKKMEDIRALSQRGDDPFGALWIDRAIAATKKEILEKKLKVPRPTVVATDIPYEVGEDIEVIWLGTVETRNERDLFEFNQAKGADVVQDENGKWWIGGKPVKDPHLDKWVVMVGDDETDQLGLRVDRWNYPRLRDKVWKIRPGKDLILVRGVKPGWMPTRQVTIHELWIIDPEI
jgi:DNA polymerase-3 subunit alpha